MHASMKFNRLKRRTEKKIAQSQVKRSASMLNRLKNKYLLLKAVRKRQIRLNIELK